MTAPHERDDLERIVPDLLDGAEGSSVLATHVERYEFAARACRDRDVLDIACGVGYGSSILRAGGALSVIGVDLSASAIEYARSRYGGAGISFAVGDAMTFRPGGPVNAAVSLETLEHVPDPGALLVRLSGLVGAGGIVVGSVPTTLSTDVNPFHLHDLSERELRELFRRSRLRVFDELRQVDRRPALSLLLRRRVGERRLRDDLLRYYLRHPDALLRRVRQTLADGLTSRYLTLAAQVES